MNTDPRERPEKPEISPVPENPLDVPEKAGLPDANETEAGTMPTSKQRAEEGTGEDRSVQEHATGRDHAEPTDVTGATNDNAIDSEYIDVGGGD